MQKIVIIVAALALIVFVGLWCPFSRCKPMRGPFTGIGGVSSVNGCVYFDSDRGVYFAYVNDSVIAHWTNYLFRGFDNYQAFGSHKPSGRGYIYCECDSGVITNEFKIENFSDEIKKLNNAIINRDWRYVRSLRAERKLAE